MSPPDKSQKSLRRKAIRLSCPACHAVFTTEVTHCPSCQFTGADSMKIFPEAAPPLLPILDVASLWNASDVRKIEAARSKVEKRFPQFRWYFCAVEPPANASLSLLGFWLLNACPVAPPETVDDRAWSVLFVVNPKNGQAAVIPGYAAEPWITPIAWVDALAAMKPAWRSGEYGKAVADFLHETEKILMQEWKNNRSNRKS